MLVGVGYSEVPDTMLAGRLAAQDAMREAPAGPGGSGEKQRPDLLLLFSTASHAAEELRAAVRTVTGESVPVIGGGASGAISNERFGYAGDQVILAAFWLEEADYKLAYQTGLDVDEEEAGRALGRKLAQSGVTDESPVLLFYDAIDPSGGGRIVAATHLLSGLSQGLGFLPDLVGAGLQGDYAATPTSQWAGDEIVERGALALSFFGAVRMDHVIMHGCRPATGYYTVTKSDGRTILEINGQPALDFLDSLLGGSIKPEAYPFFLLLGINKGDKWGGFNEKSYINHLTFGIDLERRGLVMFEPDMVAGTEFQIMYRSLDLDYMAPRIEKLFSGLEGRKPVFALYINCAGRAAGYGGMDIEDALVVQRTVAGRSPLLGIYTGVEIASIEGDPRGLDWTGVFCLFSVPK